MYGAFTYGGNVPYGAVDVTVFDFDAMLSDATPKVYTAELRVWNIATDTEETLYLGSTEFVTGPTDLPSSQPFRGVLTQPLVSHRSILGETIGVFTTGDGQLVFSNADGFYDTMVDTYAVDGREVVVRIGRISDPYTQHQVIFRGRATDWFADLDTVTVTLRDFGYRLDVPAQPDTYAGTGSAEGSSNLTGKRKPLLYGEVYGAPVNPIDTTLLIYQFSNTPVVGTTGDLLALDRGAGLPAVGGNKANYAALAAAAPPAGTIAACLSLGMFKLGGTPSGLLVVDSEPGFGSGLIVMTSEVVYDILINATGLVESDFDLSSFDAMAISQPAGIGICVPTDEAVSAADVVARLVAGVGGWAGFNREGKLALGILAAPTGNPVADFSHDEGDIVSLDRERLPSGIWPPPWRWRVAYQRNFTVFTDFAGSIAGGTREFFSQPYRLAEASDLSILDDHPLAQDPPPVEAYFIAQADAQDEADRRLTLYTAGYHLYRGTFSRRALQCDIGSLINMKHPRFGLSAGRLMTVVEISENINLGDDSPVDTVEMVVFG